MDNSANSIKKLYYSIGEVSKVTELKQYVLRYKKPQLNNWGFFILYNFFSFIWIKKSPNQGTEAFLSKPINVNAPEMIVVMGIV